MAIQVSPGVVIREFDFSDYAERTATAILAVVGTAVKGPVGVPTLITNERQLVETFGEPQVITDTQMEGSGVTTYRSKGLVHTGIQYLRYGNQLLVVRVAANYNYITGALGASTVQASAIIRDDNGSPVNIATVKAKTPGTWGNYSATGPEGIQVITSAGTASSTNKLTVKYRGATVEVFDSIKFDDTASTDQDYYITRINGISQYITVERLADPSNGVSENATYSLSGGKNGADPTGGDSPALAAADYINALNNVLANDEGVTFNVLAIPGVNSELHSTNNGNDGDSGKAVIAAAITICESRRDCVFLIDPPVKSGSNVGLTPSEARVFISGVDSSYAAFYWPWVKTYDAYNAKSVWVPPSTFVSGALAYNDSVGEPWFAAAGINRGTLKQASNIQYATTLGEREAIYGPGQVVNPIVSFTNEGIIVWGNKTTQRKATALNRLNVRRLLAYSQGLVKTAARTLLHEQNDIFTWLRFKQIVEPIFANIKARRGLDDYRVICDETTNPPEQRDQYILRGVVLLQPTKTAEVIQVDFVVTRSGANFQEFIPAA